VNTENVPNPEIAGNFHADPVERFVGSSIFHPIEKIIAPNVDIIATPIAMRSIVVDLNIILSLFVFLFRIRHTDSTPQIRNMNKHTDIIAV
jgi:hypothetical protein